MQLEKINMNRIILSKSRRDYDDGEVFALAKSIALTGLLSPITVTPVAHSDRFEIVSGNKRFFACRLLGIKELPTLIIRANPYYARATLKKGDYTDYFQEADYIKEALVKTGLSAEEFGDLSGYTQKEVLSAIKISSITHLEKELARENGVSKRIVSEIASFDDAAKRTELLSDVIRKRLREDEAINYINRQKRVVKIKVKPRRKTKLRDLRIFDNTIARALSLLKEAGVTAELNTESNNNTTEYKIKIHN